MTEQAMGKWDDRFFEMAKAVAGWSKDPDREVGAVVVSRDRRSLAVGYNGFPRGIPDTEEALHSVDLKLKLTVHAELNALLNCGFDPRGCTIYTTSFPCHECAKAIVQAGIARVVAPRPTGGDSKWKDSWDMSKAMFLMAAVEVCWADDQAVTGEVRS